MEYFVQVFIDFYDPQHGEFYFAMPFKAFMRPRQNMSML